uniref:Uncharacterized protein n=1 Tax=Ralstonia syzygii R24 TaxID=907261 RepID=G3A3L9_9RALS|nr:hypothetical protein RALSY_30216 [Ralstonia syzygii R24]
MRQIQGQNQSPTIYFTFSISLTEPLATLATVHCNHFFDAVYNRFIFRVMIFVYSC